MTIKNKQRILEVACDVFLEKGYAGASISQISTKAGVAKSLVFHHFPTKEDLWGAVKEELINHIDEKALKPITQSKSLEDFIEQVIEKRFSAHEGNPKLARLITWQQLEADQTMLMGIKNYQPDDWEKAIKNLQKNGLMTDKYPSDIICSIIYGATSNIFFDNRKKLYTKPAKVKAYRACVKESLIKALTP